MACNNIHNTCIQSYNIPVTSELTGWIVIVIMVFAESLNMSTVLQYRKIKVSSKDEAKMLDVLLSTSQQFKAISKDEYFITKKQCTLLTKKNIPYQKL